MSEIRIQRSVSFKDFNKLIYSILRLYFLKIIFNFEFFKLNGTLIGKIPHKWLHNKRKILHKQPRREGTQKQI